MAGTDGLVTDAERKLFTTITCTTEGIHKYEAIATDMWGNVSSAMTVVYYDITAPKGSVHAYGPGVSERIPMTYILIIAQYGTSEMEKLQTTM